MQLPRLPHGATALCSTPRVIDVASGSNADAADLGGKSVAEEAVTGGIAQVGGGLLMLLVMMPSADGVSPEVVSVEVQGGDDIEILNRG